MLKNTAGQYVTVYAHNRLTDTAATGDAANITTYTTLDDGVVTVSTNTVAELSATNAKGCYRLLLTQAETNATMLLVSGKSSTDYVEIDPVLIYPQVQAAFAVGAAISASGDVETDVTIWQNACGPDLLWSIYTSDGVTPRDVSACALRLLVLNYDHTKLFYLDTAGGKLTVGGANNNEITANYSTTDTATAGTFTYELWRVDGGASGDEILAYGAFRIRHTKKVTT